MENYFNYFTEIEDRYQQRRGAALLLSTLDWALIETWKDAGIPLDAVLRGIDAAFDAYDRKPERARTKKVNSLAYCSQEVLAAAQEIQEAAVGAQRAPAGAASEAAGMSPAEVSAFLLRNAKKLRAAEAPPALKELLASSAGTLEELAAAPHASLEELERRLTVMEEKVLAGLHSNTPDDVLLSVRTEAERDIAPYRSKMIAAQIEQLHRQYANKRLLERAKLPRLSLFYM